MARRPFLLLIIRFPGRPIFIQLPPACSAWRSAAPPCWATPARSPPPATTQRARSASAYSTSSERWVAASLCTQTKLVLGRITKIANHESSVTGEILKLGDFQVIVWLISRPMTTKQKLQNFRNWGFCQSLVMISFKRISSFLGIPKFLDKNRLFPQKLLRRIKSWYLGVGSDPALDKSWFCYMFWISRPSPPQVGLWHAVLASVFNGMHVVFVPYALMKVNPASWMQMVTKHREEEDWLEIT